MSTVREIIKKKGSEIWSVEPGATVHEALRLMAEKDVGALMVMSGDTVDGIISERDCARSRGPRTGPWAMFEVNCKPM